MQAVAASPLGTLIPVQRADSDEDPLIIVGTGPVGIRCAEELLTRGYRGNIVMFGDEPWEPYNRIKLSSLLAGEIGLADIANNVRFNAGERLVQHLCCPIRSLHPQERMVLDATGEFHRYSKLILALGSRAHIPAVAGVDKAGVFTFRDLRDTESLLARTARSRHLVVVGGGLLGLEAARALQRSSGEVTVVQQGPRLMNRQLDEAAADLLQQRLQQLGIPVLLNAGLAEVLGDERVQGVRLRDGSELPCDTVLLATGIKPNVELARRAWIKVASGILVDDCLQTSDPHIFAVGECAEHRTRTYGLVAPGYEQAAVVADQLLGGSARYLGSLNVSQLKVVGESVFSLGEVVDLPNRALQREISFADPQQGLYRKLVLHRGRLIGALAIGDSPENRRIQEAVQQGRRLYPWQLLRFRWQGRVWGDEGAARVATWPAEALVCQCMGVSRGRLSDALQQGCASVVELSAATSAGTVCGSCKPLLQELCGQGSEPVPAEKTAAVLWSSGVVAAVLCLLWWWLPAMQVPDSVQIKPHWDAIWNDSFAKQVSGFSLLGLSLIGLLVSLRKRVRAVRWGAFPYWRLLHVMLGVLGLVTLLAHTGLHLGANLNRWLIMDFLALTAVGALASFAIGWEHRLSPQQARRLRSGLLWGHILAVWPLPVLLSFHVLSVYYF